MLRRLVATLCFGPLLMLLAACPEGNQAGPVPVGTTSTPGPATASAGPDQAQDKVFKMPRGQDVFFKKYHYTHSDYLHFRADGTYRRIDRQHMFVEESDRGSWQQAASGEMTLASEKHYRDIECGPLEIFLWHRDVLPHLMPLKKKIAGVLKEKKDTFTRQEVEDLDKYGPDKSLSRINVAYDADPVTSTQLERLMDCIDEYLADANKNHFHVTPMTWGALTFLVWKDGGIDLTRNMQETKEWIEMERKRAGAPITTIHLMTDKATFEKESKETQEFIYYPEMTDRVRSKARHQQTKPEKD